MALVWRKTQLVNVCHAVTNAQLKRTVARFWEVEEVDTMGVSRGSVSREGHFRDDQGCFVVGMSFNQKIVELGESFAQARGRFLNLERKFL